ncbi:hypothetical protein LRN34_23925 [Enterobacter kobei]|uniref:Uncharacterized protein n=1 Tax=Leclercia adecarboxylata TaxID=83655 RepID=A0A5B8KHK2_9ENTR|nr:MULTISPECIES: DUF6685 family protein [Enterobacteriaceae]MCD2483786.1 hypothetical protein [Enterobacter kobei]MCD2510700.1 hypothetical protein [Enterobacter kobei]QDY97992.1 Hypothetical protein [Leclercia adecarboxylata]QLG00811.1 hypothetical protein [Leclercia adecarboxylata]
MTYDSGRNGLAEIPTSVSPSALARVLNWAREELMHTLGRPAGLERVIKSRVLVPYPITPPADTFWKRSVSAWDTWLNSSSSSFYFARPYTLDYRKPDGTGQLEAHVVTSPEAENLIKEEIIEGFQCDISFMKGISCSKSDQYDIQDIDELAVLHRPGLVEPITQDHLQENMSHGGLRLDRMRFADYPWAERRYYWLNEDGAHHFSAAHYQACLLQQSVPLTGTLYRYSVNAAMATALCNKWHLYVIPKEELFGSFYNSMKDFKAPFAWSALPENMHDSMASNVELCIVWLERDNGRANAVANLLAASAFPDFGEVLALLAKGDERDSLLAG